VADKSRVKVLTDVEWWNEDSILKKGKTDLIAVEYVTMTVWGRMHQNLTIAP
jgi:hypothetical protein